MDNLISKENIQKYATILKNEGEVMFILEDLRVIEVFEHSEGGFEVNVYEDYDHVLSHDILDGGICTGSEIDAIKFMF